MLNTPVVDVALGLMLFYLVMSVVVSAMKEWISGLFDLRAANLGDGIRNLIGDEYARSFYEHGLIKALARPGKRPSYIPAQMFSTALLDLLRTGGDGQGLVAPTMDQLREAVAKIEDPALRQSLLALSERAGADVADFEQRVGWWFDQTMDRVSGWYARKSQVMVVVLAAVIVVGMNADTLRIAAALWENGTLRAQVAAMATSVGSRQAADRDAEQLLSRRKVDQVLDVLPIGWACPAPGQAGSAAAVDAGSRRAWSICLSGNVGLRSPLGWLLTVAAISFGAPFWFDLLSRIVQLRTDGRKPDKPR